MIALVRPAPALILMVILVGVAPAGASGDGEPRTASYAPSSVVLTGVFGFGKLFCADAATAALGEVVPDGVCFTYAAADVGRAFEVVADDLVWQNASISVAVDVNGDGCVSVSRNGRPNPAPDYTAAACGAIGGTLPDVESGVAFLLQVFVRAAEVGTDAEACGASTGTLTFRLH